MNQYLLANGGQAVGDLNPMLLSHRAQVHRCPGSATSLSAATPSTPPARATTWSPGSGTPDIDNLVHNLLILQKAM